MRTMTRLIVLLGSLSLPAAAAAQTPQPSWYLSPFVGATFGGDTTSTATTTGVSVGWHGHRWLGVEAELANTPNFFEQDGFRTERRVLTMMGNVTVAMPGDGRLRPYAIGGFGVVQPRLSEAGGLAAVDLSQPGFNLGGGIMATWREHVGLRGDLRYVRSVGDELDDRNAFGLDVSTLGFWRLTGGLVVGF